MTMNATRVLHTDASKRNDCDSPVSAISLRVDKGLTPNFRVPNDLHG